MLVSDDGKEWEERFVIDTFDDDGCLVVNKRHEQSFFNGGYYDVLYWKHYKELTKRLMSINEVKEKFAGKIVYIKHEKAEKNMFRQVVAFSNISIFCCEGTEFDDFSEIEYSFDLKEWKNFYVKEIS